jgi:hypothetical protein
MPLYAISSNHGGQLNGWKLRALFVNPDNASSDFYYGVNFEFSVNARHWDEERYAIPAKCAPSSAIASAG